MKYFGWIYLQHTRELEAFFTPTLFQINTSINSLKKAMQSAYCFGLDWNVRYHHGFEIILAAIPSFGKSIWVTFAIFFIS